MHKVQILAGVVVFTVLIVWFQNCSSNGTGSLVPTLSAGAIDSQGDPVGQGDLPSPGNSEPPLMPSPSNPPTPPDEMCILVNVDLKDGNDTALMYLTDLNISFRTVCMSANACLNLVNDYLNLTGGVVGGNVGAPPVIKQQYTMQKGRAACAHNPKMIHLTDSQVAEELQKLETQ